MKTTLRLAILGVVSVLALSACSGAQTKAVDTGLTTANMNASELLLLKRALGLPAASMIPMAWYTVAKMNSYRVWPG